MSISTEQREWMECPIQACQQGPVVSLGSPTTTVTMMLVDELWVKPIEG